jgi:localization factor PodJL
MTAGQSQSWSLAGIDPKVREAAREAAARQGMTLAEYLNAALAARQQSSASPGPSAPHAGPRPRPRFGSSGDQADDADWRTTAVSKAADASSLAQRMELIERRTQLAVAGLDRAVATIDRSLVGLASRIEDAEAMSAEAAARIADALEHFRVAGDTLGGDVDGARARLENQAAVAEEIARRAEATANYLASTMDNRDAQVAQTLAQARAIAEEAAEHAARASADAVKELRRLQQEFAERLSETETSTRRAVASAIESVRAEATGDMIGASDGLLEQVARLEADVAARLGDFDQLKSDHAALIARIERAEANAREATAGLRQAAGAAIADLRNAQLTLAARVKQVEDVGEAGADLTDLRHAQQDIAERLAALEAKTDASPVIDALAAFEARIAQIENEGAKSEQFAHVDGAVKTLDASLQRLAARIAETESTANTAIRTLEETVSSIGARVEQVDAAQETETLRAMLEQRLDSMALSVSQMVGEARTELADQLQAALEGVASKGLEDALADVNARLANAERRQAQTIEAISLEIKRMSETVDKRLRAVEARNDDAAAVAVREELSRMASTLEQRFDEIERREAAAFDRMGLEVGRLSERLDERVGAVEVRSAQAIEHVGEQVARMAERFSQRHEALARELGERMVDSEERTGQRLADAINSMMQRLAEVEASSAEAIAPVQKAVSRVASKLEQYETQIDPPPAAGERPAPPMSFEDLEHYVELLDNEPPTSAARAQDDTDSAVFGAEPAPPAPEVATPTIAQDDDIYFTEIEDDLLIEDGPVAEARDPAPATSAAASVDDFPAEDPIAAQMKAGPEAESHDAFWLPSPSQGADIAAFKANDTPQPAPPADEPTGKNAYLAQARRAAQAQTLPKARPEPGMAPKLSLRGSSRIVVWGAASLATLLLIGGARYWVQQNSQNQEPASAEPAVEAPVADAASEPTVDDTLTVAPPAEGETPTVAGPLPPRNVTLEQAAQSGDLVAQYELALQRLSAGRSQEAIALLRGAADRGFAMAQYRLAKLYERGEGVQADLATARQWTERAAASGNRRAMHDLGVYFARGEGAPLDEAAAFRWFRQAAELGVADSQYNLGVLYQQGRGVNASPPEALFWFLVAARQGDQDASSRALALEAQLTQAQVGQARARADAFRPRAANALANGDFGPRAWSAPRPAT